jgi:hypothetical protein
MPPEIPAVLFSYDLAMVGSDLSVLDPKIDDIIGCLVKGLPKSWAPKKTYAIGPLPGEPSTYTVTGADFESAFNALQTLYISKYIGDGHLIAAPTKTRVDWLLTGTDFKPTDIVGANNKKDGAIETGNGILTFQMLAIQNAMAGGRPEYMCVEEAAMQNGMSPRASGESSPNFESSSGASPMTIVNGLIANDIRLGNGFGCHMPSPIWPAGAVMARSMWLVRQNLGNMLTGKGSIGTYSTTRPGLCWAENEEGLPTGWNNFATQYYGRKNGDNSVVHGMCFGMGFNSMSVRGAYTDPVEKSILDPIEQASAQLRNLSTGVLADSKGSLRLILVPGQILRFQALYGWTREKYIQKLADGQWEVLADIDDFAITKAAYAKAGKDITTEDKTKKFKLQTDPTNLRVICCGGDHLVAEFFNGFQSFGNTMITKPAAWSSLLSAAEKDLGPYPTASVGAYHNDL